MSVGSIVFISLFVVCSLIHLYFCFTENENFRKITKVPCMVLLGLAVVFFNPKFWLIYLGAFLGALGDLALLRKKEKLFFGIGTIAFLAGHVTYFISMINIFKNIGHPVPWYGIVVSFAILIILVPGLYPLTHRIAGKMTLMGNFYMPFLLLLGITGVVLSRYINPGWPAIFVLIGYLFFVVSDSILIATNFKFEIKRKDFYIMITYLFGEAFIISGLSLVVYYMGL